MEKKDNKRFDDFPIQKCDECTEYWKDRCDGHPKASEKPCKSFNGVRSVTIPLKLKYLQNAIKQLRMVVAVLVIWQLVEMVGELFGSPTNIGTMIVEAVVCGGLVGVLLFLFDKINKLDDLEDNQDN